MQSENVLNQIDESTTNYILKVMNDTGQTNYMIANFLNRTLDHISNNDSTLKTYVLHYDEPNFPIPKDKLKIVWYLISDFFQKHQLTKSYNSALKEMPYINNIESESDSIYKNRFHCPNNQDLFKHLLGTQTQNSKQKTAKNFSEKVKSTPIKKKKRSRSANRSPRRTVKTLTNSEPIQQRVISSEKRPKRSKSLSRTPKTSKRLKNQSTNVTPRLQKNVYYTVHQKKGSQTCPRHPTPTSPRSPILNSLVIEKVQRKTPPFSESKVRKMKDQSIILTRTFIDFESCSYNELDDNNSLISTFTQTNEKEIESASQETNLFHVKERELIKLESLESIYMSDNSISNLHKLIETQIKRLNISNPLFVLKITVVEAQNLPVFDLFGQLDPFCTIQVDNTVYKTKIAEDTKTPKWNQLFEFKTNYVDTLNVNISIYDSDPLGTDELLGNSTINLIEHMTDFSLDKVFTLNPNNEIKITPEIHLKINLEVVGQSKS